MCVRKLAMIDRIHNLFNKYKHRIDNKARTLVYGSQYRYPRRLYEGEEYMRVLFVHPNNYDQVCAWYEGLNSTQKHRKVTVICKSPDEFWQKFDKVKFGVEYTMFYFDECLGPVDSMKFFKALVPLYGEKDARYISEEKMRFTNIFNIMAANEFNNFKPFHIIPECLNDVIRQAMEEAQSECVCRSLL